MQLEGLPIKPIFRWTKICKECYENHCICSNCHIVPDDLKPICKVKSYVLETYRIFGMPLIQDEERQELLSIKNEKKYTFKVLADEIGITKKTLQDYIKGLNIEKEFLVKIQEYMGEYNDIKY